MKPLKSTIAAFLACIYCFLQVDAQGDSTAVPYINFLREVIENHPLASLASLQVQKGEEYLRKARGEFDPKLNSNFAQKIYKADEYYSIWENQLKIATRSPLSFAADYAQNQGIYLNPQLNVPGSGLFSAGFDIELGRGLFIDPARAGLRQAQIGLQQAENIQELQLNDLLLNASYAYWMQLKLEAELNLYRQARTLSETRFQAVRKDYFGGNKTAMDTLEAYLQLQNWDLKVSEASQMQIAGYYLLNNFIWKPDSIQDETSPSNNFPSMLSLDTKNIYPDPSLIEPVPVENVPLVQALQLELGQAGIQAKLYKELFKPQLTLKYRAFTPAVFSPEIRLNNSYYLGAQFSLSLFMRKELAALRLARIKMQETELKLRYKSVEVQNKALALSGEIRLLREQLNTAETMQKNARRLLEAENIKFSIGESTVFILNAREQKLVEVTLKFLSIKAKLLMKQAELLWLKGELNRDFVMQ